MGFDPDLLAHLQTGQTTTCHAWSIRRRDGTVLGFTDHDRNLTFDGIAFRADSGMTAMALQQGTGLAVDNSEAIGALTAAALTEADIDAGRYDAAEVTAWLVNWASPAQRQVVFFGTIGEIRRSGGAFRAELRGLTEGLNRPLGRVYQKPCGAVLGDRRCGVDLTDPAYSVTVDLLSAEHDQKIAIPDLPDHADGWFARGRLEVLDGPAAGLAGIIQWDRVEQGLRTVTLWAPVSASLAGSTMVRLVAGCDRRFSTCGGKFDNALNFQGFPDIPGDDWMTVLPVQSSETGGGSRRR